MPLTIYLRQKTVCIRDVEGCELNTYIPVLADFGPLFVNRLDFSEAKQSDSVFSVSHYASTGSVRRFETFELACAAAQCWALMPLWDFQNLKEFVSVRHRIMAALKKTPYWAKALPF